MSMATAEQLESILVHTNGRLIVNIAPDAVGHALAEVDNFLRMKMTGEYDKNMPSYFFGQDYAGRLVTIASLFGDLIFDNWAINDYGAFLATIVANARPDLTVDVGISSYKIAVPRGRDAIRWERQGFYRMSFACSYLDHLAYHKRFAATADQYPFIDRVELSNEIEEFIGAKGGRVAVVHFKEMETSGSASPTRVEDYEMTLGFLKDSGYTIVLAGREPMPQSWLRFGVVDYANSLLATFENDFRIMRRADVGVIGSSGIQLFLELFDKPFVQVNTKAPATPPWGRRAVTVPSLYKINQDGRTPSFVDHLRYNITHGISYDKTECTPFPPTETQIRQATDEALLLGSDPNLPMTERQKKYKALDPNGCVGFSLSRVSDSFLKDHENLF